MSNNIDRAETRIRGVYYFLKKHGAHTTRALSDEFGVSVTTIRDDLNLLKRYQKVESAGRGIWKAN